jgi:hypothetical protein
MLREIAARYNGREGGVWAYDAFDDINAKYFGGELPTPKIQWALTAHGRCLGLTRMDIEAPIITLHPSILGGTEKANPWRRDPAWLGPAYAFDVLLHEMIHISVNYIVGTGQGTTSHNCEGWIGEVNRIAPLLGLDGIEAGKSTTARVDGKVKRITTGNIPFSAVSMFPYELREHLGTADQYYRTNICTIQFHDGV